MFFWPRMFFLATDEHGFSRIIARVVGAISAFNVLLSTLYGTDAIATDEHGFSGIIARGVGAISPFNFLLSTLYGTDAIATDEHGF